MTKISRDLKHLVMLPLCALFFFIGAVTVQAATYYVATTGNNSNPGTSGSPFLTIQKCIDTVAAGDTCTVANGTYSDNDGDGVVGYVRSTNAQGSANDPITIKSTNPNGAIVIVPGVESGSTGFFITRPYYIIEGFRITGGTATGLDASNIGISFTASATGGVARNNTIHNIARTVCSNSVYGNAGVFTQADSVTIERNRIFSVGRLKNGESGCSTSIFRHDHGIYVKNGTTVRIQRNVFYDTNRGYPIHIYGGTVTNLNIYNNTFAGHNTTSTVAGQIILGSTITTGNIKNNVSYNATTGLITYSPSLSASGITVSFNLSDTLEKTDTYAGVSYVSNLENAQIGFVDAARQDFHLISSSAAIDAGTNVGLPFNGAAPDIGAYEFGQAEDEDIAAPLAPVGLSIR